MNLESLLSGIFALGLPAWLLVEQFIHGLRPASRSHSSRATGKK